MNQFSGKWSFTDENDRFELWPLPAGDYYVGVNINSSPTADAPFPPTYYPGVTKQKDASVVHVDLAEAKELELPIREIARPRTVHFVAIGLDGKPMKTIYIQLEDLRHPGDAGSYVNVDLDQNGAGMLTIYVGYSYHLHGSHWGELWERLVFKNSRDYSRNRTGRRTLRYGPQRYKLPDRRNRRAEQIATTTLLGCIFANWKPFAHH